MERMTRNDAAAYLGVDPQTITNWVNKGLLGGINDKESKRFWVNADDVKKYSEKYKMLSVSEELLNKEQKELLTSERKVNAKMQMLMHDALNVSSFRYDKIGSSLCVLLELTSQGETREKKIMQSFFDGDSINDIANRFQLSRERVRQIVIKAIRKFYYAIEKLVGLKKENDSLKKEIKDVKMQLIMQEGEKNEELSEDVPPSVFSIRLVNCNLPVRILNVTKAADIDTIGDLVQYSKFEMFKFRNFGKKSLIQLDEFIHEMG